MQYSFGYAVASIVFATCTLLTGTTVSARRFLCKLPTGYQWYQFLTLTSAAITIILAGFRVITLQMIELTLFGKRLSWLIFSVLMPISVTTGYACYPLLLLHRLSRIVPSQTKTPKLLLQRTPWLVIIIIVINILNLTSIIAVQVYDFIFLPEIVYIVDRPSIYREMLMQEVPSYRLFRLLRLFSTICTPLLVIAIEFYVNYRILTHILHYKNPDRNEVICLDEKLKKRMAWYLVALILSDIIIIVVYGLAALDQLPNDATILICYTWLYIHLLLSLKYLDMLVHQLKKPDSSVSLSVYASKTDIVHEGLLDSSMNSGTQKLTNVSSI